MGPQVSHQFAEIRDATPATGSAIRLASVPVEGFDEFQLVAKVGQGGMAEVFLGLSEGPVGFRKLVAIKRLHRHLQEDPEAVSMFVKEANVAARMQHPNIVHTHKAGRFEGQHFIAMEYLDGQPLHRFLRRLHAQEGRLPPALAVRLISDALDGLHHAHEVRDYHGRDLALIHRDISPHNLFVTLDGHVKLIDFGVAKLGSLQSHTRPGLIKGKLAYMAPEQALGESIDRRADIWSIGITLRECLSGQRVFGGGSDLEILRATISEEIEPLHELSPEIPVELAAIVDRALQRDRTLRFATALEFKEALETWLLSQSANNSRATLSAMMRALFSDVIEQRRETLCACLARAEVGRSSSPAETSIEQVDAGISRMRYRGTRSSQPVQIPAPSKLPWKVATVLGAAALAALMALVGASESSPEPIARTGAEKGTVSALENDPKQSAAMVARQIPTLAPAKPTRVVAFQPAPHTVEPPPGIPSNMPPPSAPRASTNRRLHRGQQATINPESTSKKPVRPVEDTQVANHPASGETRAHGRLILDSTPYAVVSLGNQRLGITPIDVELIATTHTLTLRNPELGIETTYRVTIPSQGSVRRRIAFD